MDLPGATRPSVRSEESVVPFGGERRLARFGGGFWGGFWWLVGFARFVNQFGRVLGVGWFCAFWSRRVLVVAWFCAFVVEQAGFGGWLVLRVLWSRRVLVVAWFCAFVVEQAGFGGWLVLRVLWSRAGFRLLVGFRFVEQAGFGGWLVLGVLWSRAGFRLLVGFRVLWSRRVLVVGWFWAFCGAGGFCWLVGWFCAFCGAGGFWWLVFRVLLSSRRVLVVGWFWAFCGAGLGFSGWLVWRVLWSRRVLVVGWFYVFCGAGGFWWLVVFSRFVEQGWLGFARFVEQASGLMGFVVVVVRELDADSELISKFGFTEGPR